MTSRSQTSPQSPFFSVAIATYNGAKTLARTIESLQHQTYPADRYEIIVVDDGSTQDIRVVVQPYNVRFKRLATNGGLSVARNAGLAMARGDIFAGFDDDCIAAPDWLQQLATGYEQANVGGVGGVLINPNQPRNLAAQYLSATEIGTPPPPPTQATPPTLLSRLQAYLGDHFRKPHPTTTPQIVSELYGANSSFPVQHLRSVGGWDPTMSGVEDSDLSKRLHARYPAHQFLSIPTAKISHEPHMTLAKLCKRAYNRGPVILRFYRQNHRIPPFFPAPFILAAALVATIARQSWPATLAVAILLPQLLYSWWPLKAIQSRRFSPLAFAYIQALEETARILGLIRGYLQPLPPSTRTYHPLQSWLTRTFSNLKIGVLPAEKHAHRQTHHILLTFDDYGSSQQIHRLLDILAAARTQAMIFVIGQWASQHPDLINQIQAAGHIIGNHTYSHTDLLTLSPDQITSQIQRGVSTPWFRPPMGRYNRTIRQLVQAQNLKIVHWTVDSDDWQGVYSTNIYRKVLAEVPPCADILIHHHADKTQAILPQLIEALRQRGLELAPLTQPDPS